MKTVVRALSRAVERVPTLLIVVALVLFGVLGIFARQMKVAQGNEGFAPHNAEIRASDRITELFGAASNESVVQIVVKTSSGDVVGAAALQAVGEAEQAIRQSDAAPYLSGRPDRPAIVSYLAPVQQAMAQQGIPATGVDDATVKAIYRRALGQMSAEQAGFVTSLLGGQKDVQQATASSGMMLVFLQPPDTADQQGNFERLTQIERSVADAVAGVQVPGVQLSPFSFTLLFADSGGFTSEVGRLFASAAAIIVAILIFVYWMKPRGNATWLRSLRRTGADMGVTMLAIIMAIVYMQGIGVLLQRIGVIAAFSAPTQIVPILLIGLGVDYAIHLTTRYREEIGEGGDVQGSIRRGIGTVGVALALATVTTVVGFLTDVFSPVPALKDFGILAAVGILVAFLLMLTFVPAVRLLLDRRSEREGRLPRDGMGASSERLLPALMERVSILAERAAIPTLIVTIVLGILGFVALTRLHTEFSITDFLPETSPTVQTLKVIQQDFGGGFGETSEVLVEPPAGGDLATPAVYNALVAASGNLASTPDVLTYDLPSGPAAQAQSPVSVIASLVRPGANGQPADPQFAAAAARLGLQPDLTVSPGADVSALWAAAEQAAPDAMARVAHVAADGKTDAVVVDVQTQAGEERAGALRTNLDAAFAPVTAVPGVTAVPTSQYIISAAVVQALSSSQISSLAITVLVAMLVLVINFWFENRRPFLGVITILPVALVVLWTFGLMWLTSIPFGPVTATLAALAVGIGVPYTIHIARRFEEDRVRFATLEEALRSTTRHTGGALAGSAFTTVAGFGILVTSTLKPFQQMGLVTAYAIGLSLAGAVLVLPSLLALWERWHAKREPRDEVPRAASAP